MRVESFEIRFVFVNFLKFERNSKLVLAVDVAFHVTWITLL